jgi:glycine oxidase
VNVIVVGAGVVGCAIAYELASRGAQVRLVDPRGTGQGATRASAGILAPTIEGHVPALLKLGARSISLYDEFVSRVTRGARLPVEYERSGTLQLSLDPGEAEGLCALARSFADAGISHTLMDSAEARRLEPALPDVIVNALLVPHHGYIAVGQLTRALAQAAINQGATLTIASVQRVEGGANPFVITDRSAFEPRADAVVIATGSWTDRIVATPMLRGKNPGLDAQPVVKPIRGQLLQVRLDRRPASHVIWGKRCYAVPWRDGTVLVGATVEDVGFDERPTTAGVCELLEEGFRLLPALRQAAFEEVRTGLRPMTSDELPAVGPSSTMRNVFYATGHYRNGVLLAPLTAALVADLVLDGRRDEDLEALRPERLGL